MKQSLEKTFEILAEKTMKNRPEVLKRMTDLEYNIKKTQEDRDQLAATLRTARNNLRGIQMLQCFVCDCVTFLGEKECPACGSDRLFKTLVTKEECDFHLEIARI